MRIDSRHLVPKEEYNLNAETSKKYAPPEKLCEEIISILEYLMKNPIKVYTDGGPIPVYGNILDSYRPFNRLFSSSVLVAILIQLSYSPNLFTISPSNLSNSESDYPLIKPFENYLIENGSV
ncbi:MAG: hypothetical protein QXO75_11130 [Nitrososphaerota archaeon]